MCSVDVVEVALVFLDNAAFLLVELVNRLIKSPFESGHHLMLVDGAWSKRVLRQVAESVPVLVVQVIA